MSEKDTSIIPIDSNANPRKTYEDMVNEVGLYEWIKDTEKQFLENAQKILNILCDEDDVPRIPVKLKKRVGSAYGAIFMGKEYEIWITRLANSETLVHEYIHYVARLFSIISPLEEEFVIRATRGYYAELEGLKHHTADFDYYENLQKELDKLDEMQRKQDEKSEEFAKK